MYWGHPGSVGHRGVRVWEYGSLRRVPMRTALSSGLRSWTSLRACRILPSTENRSRSYLRDRGG